MAAMVAMVDPMAPLDAPDMVAMLVAEEMVVPEVAVKAGDMQDVLAKAGALEAMVIKVL